MTIADHLTPVASTSRTRPTRRRLALASLIALALALAVTGAYAGLGSGEPAPEPASTNGGSAPPTLDLDDPVTRQRFAESFEPGYFG